ncbi:hypothetical protein ACHWQZ_G012947 [Mnemiopsis leidyi]
MPRSLMGIFVFVYGTLKRGFPNNHFLSGAEFVGNALTIEKYPLVIASRCNIPYLLGAKSQGHRVAGEVFKVTESQLQTLDFLEGYPDYYNRIELDVSVNSDTMLCYTYVLDRFKNCLLELPMQENYSYDDSMRYVRPADRPEGNVDHRGDVMDC